MNHPSTRSAALAPGSEWPAAVRPMTRLRSWSIVALVTIATMLQSACLSNSFEIPRDEIERLSKVVPAERGKRVRAVQRFGTADELPPAPQWAAPPTQAAQAGVPPLAVPLAQPYHSVPSYYYGYGDPYYGPQYQVGVWSSSGDSRLYPAGSLADSDRSGGSKVAGAALNGAGKAATDRENLAATMALLLLTAVVVGAVLAGTEGARYDGWLAVHPHHPLHVVGPSGHRLVALDEVREGDIGPEETAVIVGPEGAGTWLRGRAPLDRQGFSYHVGGGFGGSQLAGRLVESGGTGEIGLGVFPSGMVGLASRLQFGRGFAQGGDYLTIRAGGEAQALPIDLGWLHFGGYGGAGYEWVKAGQGNLPELDENRLYMQVGGLAELEWTTRLALYLRYGFSTALAGTTTSPWTPDFSIGLSIY